MLSSHLSGLSIGRFSKSILIGILFHLLSPTYKLHVQPIVIFLILLSSLSTSFLRIQILSSTTQSLNGPPSSPIYFCISCFLSWALQVPAISHSFSSQSWAKVNGKEEARRHSGFSPFLCYFMYRERWEERKTWSDKNRNKRKEIKEKKERDKEGKTGR